MALPVVGWPERVSVKLNWPFWLLVQVGQADTVVSSLSFSPDFSYRPPNLNVWLPFTQVKLSEMSQIGPDECDGYGPPLMVEKVLQVLVGMRVGMSLPCGKMYG